jgi:hypothetical protein
MYEVSWQSGCVKNLYTISRWSKKWTNKMEFTILTSVNILTLYGSKLSYRLFILVFVRNLAHRHIFTQWPGLSLPSSCKMSLCEFLYPWVKSLMWQTVLTTHRKYVFVNIFGRMYFCPQNKNLIMLLCIVVTWLIAQGWGEGAKSTIGIRRHVKESG